MPDSDARDVALETRTDDEGEEPTPAVNASRSSHPRRRTHPRYELREQIGAGGGGAVYEAFDHLLERLVVVKELHRETARSLSRFDRETLITARLQHPGIVPVYDVGNWDSGEQFYAMKRVEGRSLRQLANEATSFEARVGLLDHVIAAADAVAFAHSHGVLHRDLKPANIMVGSYGETLVIDWGLATALTVPQPEGDDSPERRKPSVPAVEEPLTRTHDVLGTPAYMPPEQANGLGLSETADVYSLGAILYRVLSGHLPYCGSSAEIIAELRAGNETQPLVEVAPDVPAELSAIVDKAMKRDPIDRYASVAELRDDLRRFRTGRLVGVFRYSAAAILLRWARNNPLVVGASLVALVAVGVAVQQVRAERDLAQRESARARLAEAASTQEKNRLVLLQAEQMLNSDPTRALAWLKTYQGNDTQRAAMIASEAVARGTARHVVVPGKAPVAGFWPRGNKYLSLRNNWYVLYHDAANGEYDESRLPSHESGAFAASPVEPTLFVAANNNRVYTLTEELGKRKPLPGTPLSKASLVALAISPDGESLAVSRSDGVYVRRVEDGSGTQVGDSGASAVAWLSPDLLAYCTRAGRLVVAAGATQKKDVGSCLGDNWQRLAAGGERAAAVSSGGDHIVFYDARSDTTRRVRLPSKPTGVGSLASRDSFAVGTERGQVFLVRADGSAEALGPPLDGVVEVVVANPDHNRIAASDRKGQILVHDLETSTSVILRGGTHWYTALHLSANGDLLSGTRTGEIRSWQDPLRGLTRTTTLPSPVIQGAWNTALNSFAVGLQNGQLWTVDRAGTKNMIGQHDDAVTTVRWSPSEPAAVISAAWDGALGVWSPEGGGTKIAATDKILKHFELVGHDLIVSGGEDHRVRLHEQLTGNVVQELEGHLSEVYRVGSSPDGNSIASASSDGTARLWRLHGGAFEQGPVLEHDKAAVSGIFWVAGDRWVTTDRAGTIRVWTQDGRSKTLLSRQGEDASQLTGGEQHRYVAATYPKGQFIVYDAEDDSLFHFDAFGDRVSRFVVDDRSHRVGAGLRSGQIRVLNLLEKSVLSFVGHQAGVFAIAFTNEGGLVSADFAGGVRFWNMADLAPVPTTREELTQWLSQVTTMTLGTLVE